jgi:hypothetical protein
MRRNNWPELAALTSTFSVELPGIEAAYNAAELRKRATSQHDSTWEFTGVDGCVVDPRQHALNDARRAASRPLLAGEPTFPVSDELGFRNFNLRQIQEIQGMNPIV